MSLSQRRVAHIERWNHLCALGEDPKESLVVFDGMQPVAYHVHPMSPICNRGEPISSDYIPVPLAPGEGRTLILANRCSTRLPSSMHIKKREVPYEDPTIQAVRTLRQFNYLDVQR
jgi:hypothetical protein